MLFNDSKVKGEEKNSETYYSIFIQEIDGHCLIKGSRS